MDGFHCDTAVFAEGIEASPAYVVPVDQCILCDALFLKRFPERIIRNHCCHISIESGVLLHRPELCSGFFIS